MMSAIQITDTLHQRLTNVAGQRGESVDDFVVDILEEFLQVIDDTKPKSLLDALADARAQLEKDRVPLISSWSELEVEVAERRGGYYSN